jgi:YidC/Oxa1 family membrane protein insertase
MLGVAIDLRHATWLWVPDLSAPDPHWVLPIAIVVTMFFMQRMTPQAGMDPAQQKMMNFMMPAMLGYISFNLAAGLCLYWAVGQLIGIVQQFALNRSSLGREMREMMEKRARFGLRAFTDGKLRIKLCRLQTKLLPQRRLGNFCRP